MENGENILWTEEGLLSIKYNNLRRIAKEKHIVVRRTKKIDIVRALLESHSQLKNEEFNHSGKILEKNDQQSNSTPKNVSTKYCVISGEKKIDKILSDIQNPLNENIVEKRKSLLTGSIGKDRRSTYLKENSDIQSSLNENTVEKRNSSLMSGLVGKDRRSTYLKEDSDIQNSLNENTVEKRNSSLKSGLSGKDAYLKEDSDIQSYLNENAVEKGNSSLKSGSVGKDRRSTYLKEDSDIQNPLNDDIVEKSNSSLMSGLVGKDRCSTYLKEDSDVEGVLDTSKLISSETDTWLTCSSKRKNQRLSSRKPSPFLRIATPIQNNLVEQSMIMSGRTLRNSSKKNSLFLHFASPIQNNLDEPPMVMSDQRLKNSSRNNSQFLDIATPNIIKSDIDGQSLITSDQKLRRSSRTNSSVLATASFMKNNDSQLDIVTDLQENSLQEGSVKERNTSLKTGIDKDRHSTYLNESKENDPTTLQVMNSSEIEFEDVSLIRVTPDKTDLPAIKSNKRVTFQAGKESLEKRSTPRKIVKTPHKAKGVTENALVAKKMPNFSAIHKERFKKMESLIDMKKRFEEKAKRILNSPVPKCAIANRNVTPGKCKMISKPVQIVTPSPRMSKVSAATPKVNTPSSTSINRFGFKQRIKQSPNPHANYTNLKAYARQIVDKNVRVESEKKKEENKEILKGVRLNRRFTLHMQARGLPE